MRGRSLRQRLVLIVLLGAIAPLALAGLWLSSAAVRSAEEILRGQLQQHLGGLERGVARRWVHRHGELLMVAGNDVVTRSLERHGTTRASISRADSAFMLELFGTLRESIPRMRLSNSAGETIWDLNDVTVPRRADSLRALNAFIGRGATSSAGAPAPEFGRLMVRIPVVAGNARVVGELEAEVSVAAILPMDSMAVPPEGLMLQVVDRGSGASVRQWRVASNSGDTPDDGRMMELRASLTEPAIDLVLSSPTEAFVGPFRQTARFGLLVLVGVTVSTLLLSAYFTARTTRSLQQLAEAANAVAGGDLQRHVPVHGEDEVGQVARSFNAMTESLRGTLRELSQRNALAAVGEFAASLSHEVRNGLQSVRVDLQRVHETMPPDDTAGALLDRAVKGVRRLDGTVTSALAVARSVQAAMHDVDLVTVLNEATRAAQSSSARDVVIEFAAETSSFPIRGESEALERLFLNLLLNAMQASPPGGRVFVELANSDDGTTVSIANRGPVLSAAELERMERPFYSSKPGGTGLGLTIARKITEAHGGTLHIASAEAPGTVVEVRLPRGTA